RYVLRIRRTGHKDTGQTPSRLEMMLIENTERHIVPGTRTLDQLRIRPLRPNTTPRLPQISGLQPRFPRHRHPPLKLTTCVPVVKDPCLPSNV
ncbi:hypothetical protein AB0C96_41610, partial [Streptomyces sp. NPDC048506]|uniref:hypothetical protein n=1 Tax=Streptomyces sp. NPDC048506 TaxID=3155028 RepID=UPI00344517A5